MILYALNELQSLSIEQFHESEYIIYVFIFVIAFSVAFGRSNKSLLEKHWFLTWINTDSNNKEYLRFYNSCFMYSKQMCRIAAPIVLTPILQYDLKRFSYLMIIMQITLMLIQISTQTIGLIYLINYIEDPGLHVDFNRLLYLKTNYSASFNNGGIMKVKNYNYKDFMNEKIFYILISAAALCCTILDFNYQSIGYMSENPGFDNDTYWLYFISLFRGLAAITSISGIYIYNKFKSTNVFDLYRYGLNFLILALLPIIIVAIMLYCYNDQGIKQLFSLVMLICMTISRGGLFLLDVCLQQIILENTAPDNILMLTAYSDSVHWFMVFFINMCAVGLSNSYYFGMFAIWSITNIVLSRYIYNFALIKIRTEDKLLLDNSLSTNINLEL